jgi:hypothetical protein
MIPLFRKDFPSRKADLGEALDETLHRFVEKAGPIVEVRSRVFPYVDEIAVNLDGAIIDLSPPKLAKPEGETGRAFEAAAVNVTGRRVSVGGVPIDVRTEMRDVIFDWGYDANNDAVLILRRMRDGHLMLSVSQLLLEEAIMRAARARARLYGIELEQLRLFIRARGRRSIAADFQIQAKKFFARAKIDIYLQLDITDEFVVKISQIRCKGDGKLGSFACGTLQPLFDRILEKSFALKSLPLGANELRDVHVAVADTVDVTVDFGSGQA